MWVESLRADATQESSVTNDTPNYLHIGEFVERKNEIGKIGKRKKQVKKISSNGLSLIVTQSQLTRKQTRR